MPPPENALAAELCDPLLKEISAESPGGGNLKYSADIDGIEEARRQDDDAPRGQWEREIKNADYRLVAKLASNALISKSKDLQIAVWLAEAWIYELGSSGLVSGIYLLHSLVDKFWDDLYPKIEDGDLEDRARHLDWFGSYFDPAKRSSPALAVYRLALNKDGHDWLDLQNSRKVPTEAEVKGDADRVAAREKLLAQGKIAPEAVEKAFEATPKSFYKQLDKDLKDSLESLKIFDDSCREKFAKAAPSFGRLRKSIEEVSLGAVGLLKRKLERDPDPVEETQAPAIESPSGSLLDRSNSAAAGSGPAAPIVDLAAFEGGAITSPEQATLHVLAAAVFLRRNQPSSPLSYLLLRALRWGEVRAAGAIESSVLSAPSGDTRTSLRASAAMSNWQRVLDIAETAMANATGRGWLDLQRYTVKACDELGYAAAAKSLRSELKCFLAEFPQLPKAILNDDTGAANPETLAWLQQEGLLSAG